MAASDFIELPQPGREEALALLGIARLAIASRWDDRCRDELSHAIGSMPLANAVLACFVTLHEEGRLRGCIGCLEPQGPLREALPHFARLAAFGDPRFPPLEPPELGGVSISISLLGPLSPMEVEGRAELLASLMPGIDGLWLMGGGRRATFLPAVWRELPDPAAFLDHLLRKGGWPPGGWPEGLSVWRYRVREFAEEG
ncbi:hypothetical protein ATO46_12615 [Aeromonas schubertii]|uniref:AmmeMemoRadiSam system protein A n=1 Tax=Aeromonas schubertii TaxID=652 RepID=UPI00067E75CA|nr:AmmeMemoRadiSam system protein A [Aeromonas schubertii]KUE81326.1 hypothetical protein ATO46_12615 [Aeromonas schubertii]